MVDSSSGIAANIILTYSHCIERMCNVFNPVYLIQILCFWTLSIILFLFKNETFWRLDSGSPEVGTNSVDWVQLSRFYLKTETDSSRQNAVF
jgi:hypothetical protein